MTTFKITATAPTSYQLQSLTHFGLDVKSYPNGAHIGELEFETEEAAKNHLKYCVDNYFDTEEEISQAYGEIDVYGSIRLDAVTARIEFK